MKLNQKEFTTINGVVVHGDKRGREIGFPTANLDILTSGSDIFLNNILDETIFGVYASLIKVKNKWHKSISHFGPSRTFNIEKPSLEVYIFGFNEDIYGEIVELKILDKIRGTAKFNSVSELISQIKEDVKKAKMILN